MGREKISPTIKQKAVTEIEAGRLSQSEVAKRLGVGRTKELLVLTDHSVREIAQKVGFGDASNFSTRFAKATGQSPLQYRKSALKSVETCEQG